MLNPKHTATMDTGTGTITAVCRVPYRVPCNGDTLNIYGHDIVLTADMVPAVNHTYDKECKMYRSAGVVKTSEPSPRIVFYGDGVSWRQGEYCLEA